MSLDSIGSSTSAVATSSGAWHWSASVPDYQPILEVESQKGVGTTLRIKVPLTLAIMDGMSVGVGGESYIVPIASVVESFQVKPDMIRTIGGSNRVVQVREQFLPVVHLEHVFDVPRAGEPIATDANNVMVVLESEGRRIAMLVDELLGQHRDVLGPFAQGGKPHRDHVDAEEEILAEGSSPHHVLEVAVGRGDDPHVHVLGLRVPDGDEGPLLQHAQELHLQPRRHVADLVQQQRPAALHQANAGFVHVRAVHARSAAGRRDVPSPG